MADLTQNDIFLSAVNEADWKSNLGKRMFDDGNDCWTIIFLSQQAFNLLVFFIGYFCIHISIIDVAWGIMPLVPMTMILVERYVIVGPESISVSSVIVFCLVAIWGARLALHIGCRYTGPDVRYLELLKQDKKCPQPCHAISTWLRNFFLQASLSTILSAPPIKVLILSDPKDALGVIEIVGMTVWALGLIIETVGDIQLQRFLRNPNRVPGSVIDTGLWRYTRHPNYFGDSMIWYGIYIFACGGSTGPAGGYWTFYSPLMMHFMLRCVSGVLILEAQQSRKPEYRVYKLETNCFIPWFYKKIEGKEREQLIEKFKVEIEEDLRAQKGSILFGIIKKDWRKYLMYKGGEQDGDDDDHYKAFADQKKLQ